MGSRKRRDDWLDDDEYPDERDVEDFGDGSPSDYDRLTLGRVGRMRPRFWTPTRMVVAIVAFILLLTFLLAELAPLLNR